MRGWHIQAARHHDGSKASIVDVPDGGFSVVEDICDDHPPNRFSCEFCGVHLTRTFAFNELRTLLLGLGFAERIKGSHHIFTREDIAEILNLQPQDSMAKPYQVKQVRKLLVRYKLAEGAQ